MTAHRPPPPLVGDPSVEHRPPPPVAPRPPAWRMAPIPLVLAILSVPGAVWLSIWGLDNINHCDELVRDKAACGLGFAVDIPVAWVAMVVLGGTVLGLGFVRLPRWAAWGIGLMVAAAIWGLAWFVLSLHRP